MYAVVLRSAEEKFFEEFLVVVVLRVLVAFLLSLAVLWQH